LIFLSEKIVGGKKSSITKKKKEEREKFFPPSDATLMNHVMNHTTRVHDGGLAGMGGAGSVITRVRDGIEVRNDSHPTSQRGSALSLSLSVSTGGSKSELDIKKILPRQILYFFKR
jgi:hypothetical protein